MTCVKCLADKEGSKISVEEQFPYSSDKQPTQYLVHAATENEYTVCSLLLCIMIPACFAEWCEVSIVPAQLSSVKCCTLPRFRWHVITSLRWPAPVCTSCADSVWTNRVTSITRKHKAEFDKSWSACIQKLTLTIICLFKKKIDYNNLCGFCGLTLVCVHGKADINNFFLSKYPTHFWDLKIQKMSSITYRPTWVIVWRRQ